MAKTPAEKPKTEDMKKILEAFPEQCSHGWEISKDIKVSGDFNKIVVCGMGGSALPGEMLKSYLEYAETSLPVIIIKNYRLPKFVDDKTLFFAVSYSGETEETLTAYREALRRQSRIIAVASGGKLEQLSGINKNEFIKIPAGVQPRQGYGYMLFSMLRALQNSGIIGDISQDVSAAITSLRHSEFIDAAQQLSKKLFDRIPLIYSSEGMRAAAYKWKINFNENSKIHAFSNALPELSHNELVGFTKLNGEYSVILLRENEESDRLKKRMDIVKDIIKSKGVSVTEVMIKGQNRLSRIISASYIGDWTSYFLAQEYGIDPTPVMLVEELKRKMSDS